MIVTVTLNLALDVTYGLPHLAPGAVNRVTAVAARAGGKGVNVARVLHRLGVPAMVTGLVGGPDGDAVRAELRTAGLADALYAIGGETRRTVTVTDAAGGCTGLYEPGPSVTGDEWEGFAAHYRSVIAGARVVVLSGSLPPGVPVDAYARLARLADEAGVAVVLDADGAALRAGVAARPAVVTPNAAELRAATGDDDPRAGAAALRRAGARDVVVTLGEAGVLAVTGAGVHRLAPPAVVAGNPTGAGDAAVAALARGLAEDRPWPARLIDAVALSAAAVHAPLAGDIDPSAYRRLRTLLGHEPDTGATRPSDPTPGPPPEGGPHHAAGPHHTAGPAAHPGPAPIPAPDPDDGPTPDGGAGPGRRPARTAEDRAAGGGA